MLNQVPSHDFVWYAIYTRSRAEKKVYNELLKRNIDTFLPMRTTIRQWSDRKKKVEVPLFNYYIFVNITDRQHLPVLQVDNVVKFVSFEGKAVPIPPQQIEAIKAYLGEGAPDYDESGSDLESGVNIEITRGPMMGLTGVLINLHGKHRVKVEIECVGQSLLIDVPRTSLRRI